MSQFFVPSWNGDTRFNSLDDGSRVEVVVHDPTAAEVEAVEKLISWARGKGWTKLEKLPEPTGKAKRWRKSTFVLDGSMADVGAEFVRLVRPSKSAITALRFSNGEVHVTEATETKAALVRAEESKDAGAKAVSVKRPTMCCPQCVPGAIEPASEVLQSFLSPSQHRDWANHRAVEVEGGTTGHRYVLAHRHSKHAQKFGRICYDADDRGVLHFHDLSHPPEEEVLGAMLLLQHRENWVRNEASCFEGGFRHVLKNPFGGYRDGVKDAALMQGLGNAIMGLGFGRDMGEDVNRVIDKAVTDDLVDVLEELARRFEGRRPVNRILGF